MEQLLCPWESPTLLFFSSNVPALVHYSHVIAILMALAIGVYVFAGNHRSATARLFLFLVTTFSAWTILDLVLWATNRPDVVMFSWSLQILLEPMTYVVAFYLYHHFLHGAWPSFRVNVAVALAFLPIVLLLPTSWNLQELYLSDCEAIEGPLAKYFTHIFHASMILVIGFMASKQIPLMRSLRERQVAIFFGIGLVGFLLAFSSGTIIGSLTDDWVLSQFGLFGMPFFAACIAYSIVRFKAFDAKVITAEILVVALGIGTISLTALQKIQNVRIVATITFTLVCAIGYILVRNVRKEIEQRELIEKQEKELQVVNQQQESLLHFISHEVKGFLSDGQNAFAAIVDGDFGEAPPKVREISQTALQKMRNGVSTVMDILDASNLKKGSISFNKTTFDLRQVIEHSIESMRARAEQKRIAITFEAAPGEHIFIGDAAKIERHVVRNLIDNALRYTPSGTISVSLQREHTVMRLVVADTGVGITPEDMEHLFTEGGHGKDSIKINVDSTGFGLFVAKQVVSAHGGKIWAESEGKGKGSKFTVELPLTA